MPLKQINTPDRDLQLVQANVSSVVLPLEAIPMVGGNVLPAVSLVAAQDNLVPHKLGRAARYFIVMNINANTAVWSIASAVLGNATSDATYINLRCAANATVTLWVN